MEEYLDILDQHGRPSGKSCAKSEVHEKGHWHGCVHIWLYDNQGQVLIQKRSSGKQAFPDLWDVSVAGHIATGETPLFSAQRELLEELGIKADLDKLVPIGTFKTEFKHTEKNIDKEFNHVYIVVLEIPLKNIQLQEEEVSEIHLIPISELQNKISTDTAELAFVPYPTNYIAWVVHEIFKRIETT